MANIKKSIYMHYKINEIQNIVIHLDYPLTKNLDLDSELKNIYRSCTRIKKLIEKNKIVFRGGNNDWWTYKNWKYRTLYS